MPYKSPVIDINANVDYDVEAHSSSSPIGRHPLAAFFFEKD